MSRRDTEYTAYVAARLTSLRRLATVLCGDRQRADDLVQTTLTNLYVHCGKVRAAEHADAYARAVLVHEFIHERRSAWSRRVTLSNAVADLLAATVDQDAAIDLRAAMAALPPRQRVAGVVPGARPGPRPAAAGPSAPRQFNPLITNLSFGFLPSGEVVQQGGVEPTLAFTAAGDRHAPFNLWEADAHAQGQCHLTGNISKLSCPDKIAAQLTGPAPAVGGHRAYWASIGLVWQYARGGWAFVYAPVPAKTALQHDPQLQRLVQRHL